MSQLLLFDKVTLDGCLIELYDNLVTHQYAEAKQNLKDMKNASILVGLGLHPGCDAFLNYLDCYHFSETEDDSLEQQFKTFLELAIVQKQTIERRTGAVLSYDVIAFIESKLNRDRDPQFVDILTDKLQNKSDCGCIIF